MVPPICGGDIMIRVRGSLSRSLARWATVAVTQTSIMITNHRVLGQDSMISDHDTSLSHGHGSPQ